jgi:hypothetical protein
MKSGGALYQTTRMSLSHLKVGVESEEKESQLSDNRVTVLVPARTSSNNSSPLPLAVARILDFEPVARGMLVQPKVLSFTQ